MTRINGLGLVELKQIDTPGGPVLHMLRSDSPMFDTFGEVYFSEVFPGAVKAWKRHRQMTQLFAVPAGRIKFAVYDDRAESPSMGTVDEIVLGRPDKYCLLRIPPMLWYGFTCVGDTPGLICNCADLPHTDGESERISVDSPEIPYSWS